MSMAEVIILAILATFLLSSMQVDGAIRKKKYYLKPSGIFPSGEYMAVKKNDSCPARQSCSCPPQKKICPQKDDRVCTFTSECPCPQICCQVRGKAKRFVCIKCRKKYMNSGQNTITKLQSEQETTVGLMPMRLGDDKKTTPSANQTDQTNTTNQTDQEVKTTNEKDKKIANEMSPPEKTADQKVGESVASEKESKPAVPEEAVSEPREIKVDKIIEKDVEAPPANVK